MRKRFYAINRDLHLYAGLFLSPFVLVFAISVFYLVHPRMTQPAPASGRAVSNLDVTDKLELLSGRHQVNALRPVLDALAVKGEISYIRQIAKEHRLIIPVLLPGRETTVDLNLPTRTAVITSRDTGLADALIHLHKMPGPHNANIRGNSSYIRAWKWLADITTYGVLFLTLSGLYLWMVLRAERRIGLVLLSAGGISFFGLLYAICY